MNSGYQDIKALTALVAMVLEITAGNLQRRCIFVPFCRAF